MLYQRRFVCLDMTMWTEDDWTIGQLQSTTGVFDGSPFISALAVIRNHLQCWHYTARNLLNETLLTARVVFTANDERSVLHRLLTQLLSECHGPLGERRGSERRPFRILATSLRL